MNRINELKESMEQVLISNKPTKIKKLLLEGLQSEMKAFLQRIEN